MKVVWRQKGFQKNRSRAIGQQVGQRERRLARFLSSTSGAAAALPWSLADQPQNRNQPQIHRALDALSPFDAVSRARLRMTVGEAIGEQRPLIIVRRNDACSADDHEPQNTNRPEANTMDINATDPIYPDNAPWLAHHHGEWGGGIATVCLLATCWFVITNWKNPKTNSLYVITALWAFVPPLSFWYEYYFIYRRYGAPNTIELFAHGQQVCAALWVGVVAALLGVLSRIDSPGISSVESSKAALPFDHGTANNNTTPSDCRPAS